MDDEDRMIQIALIASFRNLGIDHVIFSLSGNVKIFYIMYVYTYIQTCIKIFTFTLYFREKVMSNTTGVIL